MFTFHHLSRVTCDMSNVLCNMSHVTFFISFLQTTWCSQSVQGPLSIGPTLSSFFLRFKNFLLHHGILVLKCFKEPEKCFFENKGKMQRWLLNKCRKCKFFLQNVFKLLKHVFCFVSLSYKRTIPVVYFQSMISISRFVHMCVCSLLRYC